KVVADAPDQEISVGAPADGRVGVNQQVPAIVLNRVDEALPAVKLFGVVEHAPLGPGTIKDKIDELAWKFSLVLFELLNVRRQAQRAARRGVWRFAFRAHRFELVDLNRVRAFASI